jgi:hypothetical protein
VNAVIASTGPNAYWFLTRASGVVALVLLTVSICLGIAGTVRWHTKVLPRFAVAGLHRNLTLLAIIFVGFHVATTVFDGFAPIGWKDAIVPFLSPYRPVWLGLGAVAFDLLLALVVTSLVRVRIGLRIWRATHWLAYASWPVALLHTLGTGSDARLGWLETLASVCAVAVAGALAVRLWTSRVQLGARVASAAAAAAVLLGIALWYHTGPGAHGWAARAGTPAALLAHTVVVRPAGQPKLVTIPKTFTARFAGRLDESQNGAQLVDVRIDGTLTGSVRGRLRLVLEGIPLDGGGVSMTSSGVAFAVTGSSVYEGHITDLQGTRVSARVAAGSSTIDLRLALRLGGSAVAGTLHGTTV